MNIKAIYSCVFLLFYSYVGLTVAVNFEFEGDIQFNKPYLFVSLGGNCWQAQALRNVKAYSLRDAAFPFDWLLSFDSNGLVKCLDEKFKYFLEDSYFRRYDGITHLENYYYKFKFTHDWPFYKPDSSQEAFKGQLAFIKKKYTRRINRFNNLSLFKGKVFFIRCFQSDPNHKGEWGWNSQNAQNLNSALKRYFPKLNFTLVVVSCTEKNVSEIGIIDEVKEYKISNLTTDNFKAYQAMYNDLLHEFSLDREFTNSVSGY